MFCRHRLSAAAAGKGRAEPRLSHPLSPLTPSTEKQERRRKKKKKIYKIRKWEIGATGVAAA